MKMNRGYGGWAFENGNKTYLYNTLKRCTFQGFNRITVGNTSALATIQLRTEWLHSTKGNGASILSFTN
jgi:hypothetical protein